MESYKPYARNPYGRGMNQFGGSNRQGQPRCANSACSSVYNSQSNQQATCGIKGPASGSCDTGCKDSNSHMRHMPLAMGYVPMQSWGDLYDPATAICQGTAFPDLNLIFCGSRGKM